MLCTYPKGRATAISAIACQTKLRSSVGSQASQPHLEDGTTYYRSRPTRLDEIKNFHSTDTIATENCGTHGRLT